MTDINQALKEKADKSESPSAQRRILIGSGALAALVGVGVANWWGQSAPAAVASGSAEPVPGLWGLEWDTPDGGRLKMATLRGRPLLINFWATWCPPCVEELPLINAFYQQNKANGWQVIGLAVDKLSSVQSFLAKMPLDFPHGLAGLSGTELGKSLGNLSGGLPFTVVLGADGSVVQRKMGKLSEQDLAAWARLK